MKKINSCTCPGAMAASQQAMLAELQQLSFSLVELNLYLDTHPEEQQAVNEYNALFQQYWEAKSGYELQYGPLNNFGHCPASYPWSWISNPWPWEQGGAV